MSAITRPIIDAAGPLSSIPGVITPETSSGRWWARFAAKVNSHPTAVFVAISAIYFGITFALSSIKLLWLDEFITFYISKLGNVRSIWHALSQGADPNPPLNYFLVLASTKLFGENAIAARIPGILASWAGLAALYAFLRGRIPAIYAAAGVLFFMSTAAFDYSFESRSYPLMLGFCALSLILWRWTIEGQHKTWAAVGMGTAMAAGLSSNYFAVLAFFPIAAGELVRDIRRRKIEWRVWIALAVGGSILLLYLPLINKAVATFSPYAWNKVNFDAITDSYVEMVETILWPSLALLYAGVVIWLWEWKRRLPAVLPMHEVVAALMLMLYPFIGYAVAEIRGGMLSPRFVIPMCYGFAIATAATAYRLFQRSSAAAVFFLLLMVGWLFAREGVVAKMYYDQRLALYRVIDALPRTGTIAVSDSLLVLPLHHYAPPEIASRIVFPVDFWAIRKYKGEDSPEQNLWNGRKGIYPVPIVSLNEFTSRNSRYVIAAPSNNWLVQELGAQGRPPRLLPYFTDTKDIRGFTPLCHDVVWFFQNRPYELIGPEVEEPDEADQMMESNERSQ
jgi:hypothetical protein